MNAPNLFGERVCDCAWKVKLARTNPPSREDYFNCSQRAPNIEFPPISSLESRNRPLLSRARNSFNECSRAGSKSWLRFEKIRVWVPNFTDLEIPKSPIIVQSRSLSVSRIQKIRVGVPIITDSNPILGDGTQLYNAARATSSLHCAGRMPEGGRRRARLPELSFILIVCLPPAPGRRSLWIMFVQTLCIGHGGNFLSSSPLHDGGRGGFSAWIFRGGCVIHRKSRHVTGGRRDDDEPACRARLFVDCEWSPCEFIIHTTYTMYNVQGG